MEQKMKTTKHTKPQTGTESESQPEGSAETKKGTTGSGVARDEKNGKADTKIPAEAKSDKVATSTVEIPDTHLPTGMTLVGYRWIDETIGTTPITLYKSPDEVQDAIAALAKRWHPKKHEFLVEILVKSATNELYARTPDEGWVFVEQLPA
jgi:hypothetical protein